MAGWEEGLWARTWSRCVERRWRRVLIRVRYVESISIRVERVADSTAARGIGGLSRVSFFASGGLGRGSIYTHCQVVFWFKRAEFYRWSVVEIEVWEGCYISIYMFCVWIFSICFIVELWCLCPLLGSCYGMSV